MPEQIGEIVPREHPARLEGHPDEEGKVLTCSKANLFARSGKQARTTETTERV
jgi:hypothetical protein